MSVAAPLTRTDRAQQHRRGMLAKVHIAKQQLGMINDDYRAVLLRIAGRISAAELTDGELEAVLAEFERMGFTAKARRPGPKPADHPVARKARAMWISLGHLGAIDDPSETALEAFARRQLGCAKMQWADQRLGYRLIEALKAIADRHGWTQQVGPALTGRSTEGNVIELKRRLVEAIMTKLIAAELIPEDWRVQRAASELGGVVIGPLILATMAELDSAAQALGAKLRLASGKPIR